MLWILLAEILLIISMILGLINLYVMSQSERELDQAGPWTFLWRIVVFGVVPVYFICLFQIPNSISSWAGPRVAIQSINIFCLVCAVAGAASLTFLHDHSREWLSKKPRIVRMAVPLLICLWAEAIAAAIPFMVRASSSDLGWAEYRLPTVLTADAAANAADEIATLNRRHEICKTAVARIPTGNVSLALVSLSAKPTGGSARYAIALPSITDPRESPFELSFIFSPPRRDEGPIIQHSVVFYSSGRTSWCDISESGTAEWRGTVSSAELRRLFVWATDQAASDAQYWQRQRTRPLEWAAVGVLEEVGNKELKIDPANNEAELLDKILFWVKKLFQAAILALLAKGLTTAFKPWEARSTSIDHVE